MTTKNRKPSYRQQAYDNRLLGDGDAVVRLREQWGVIGQFVWQPTIDDHEALRKVATELDVPLVRYALTSMRSHLQEAAIRDTARLIAELVLDTSPTEKSLKNWEAWLDAAPCWPAMAKDNWAEAVRQAAWIVVEVLTESGVQFDTEAQAALADQVARLEIEDLLPKATIERLFPENPEGQEC